MTLAAQIEAAVASALCRHGYFSNEDGRKSSEEKIDLQSAVVEALGAESCEREVPAIFPPTLAPPDPPAGFGSAKDVCESGRKARRIDILWRSGTRLVAIELKLRRITNWKGTYCDGKALMPRVPVDAYGYEVLKDIHRLERLTTVASRVGQVTPTDRFALFLTNDPYEFEARVPHANLQLTHGRTFEPGHLVQYNLRTAHGRETSPKTLWRDYAPFRLVGRYTVNWRDLVDDVSRFMADTTERRPYPTSRLLLLPVGDGAPSAPQLR